MDFTKINRRTFFKWLTIFSIFFLNLFKREIFGQVIGKHSIYKKQKNSNKSIVLRIHCRKVIKDNFTNYSYLDSIKNDKLDKMLEEGIKVFTGQRDIKKAWLQILTNYTSGDKIAIKPNFNFVNNGYKFTITSPQLINSVVKQLIEMVGVKPEEIFLYDLCKKIHEDIVRKRINYPISYIQRMGSNSMLDKIRLRFHYGLAAADMSVRIKMRENIVDESGTAVRCYIPKVVTQSQHLINMPLLTNHIYIANSGALKNHFGTVRFSNFHSFPDLLHGKGLGKSIVDINQHPHIKNKTRIIIGDGVFGIFDRGEGEGKKTWKTFNNDFPKSIFISRDPVAIDSVMASIIIQERKRHQFNVLSTEYLNDAMNNGLGIYEISGDNGEFKSIEYATLSI